MRLQCLNCGGTYDDVCPDGMLYFHTCPPQRAAASTGSSSGVSVSKGGATTSGTSGATASAAAWTPRNENRPGTRPEDTGKLKAVGLGVKAAADATT